MIKRRTPLKRSSKPIPRKRAKPRRGPLRDPGYLAFLRKDGKCRICKQQAPMYPAAADIIDPAHGPVNGMRSKGPDNEAVPLCRYHHDEQTRLGWPAFEAKYGFARAIEAFAWWTAYGLQKAGVCLFG